MRQRSIAFVKAIVAGLCIAVGGAVYLTLENKVTGSLLFTVGLFTICTHGLNLYTGKVCYVFENNLSYAVNVAVIWLGNLVGTWLGGQALLATRVGDKLGIAAQAVCEVKLTDDLLSVFILAMFCNLMIFIGVDGYNKNPHEVGKYVALFLGVMVFILCGFEHCIANMFYFTVGRAWGLRTFGYLLVMTLGNAVGGIVVPVLRSWWSKNA